MGLGFIERMKQTFAKKPTASAANKMEPRRQSALGEMTFEEATRFVAPNGGLDASRRPAPPRGPAQVAVKGSGDGSAKKNVPATNYASLPPLAQRASQPKPSTMYTSPLPQAAKVKPATMYESPLPTQPVMTREQEQPSAFYEAPERTDEQGAFYVAPNESTQPSVTATQSGSGLEQGARTVTSASVPSAHDGQQRGRPALSASALARLREGAKPELLNGREAMTDEDLAKEGWSILPMNSQGAMHDQGAFDFKTMYHYEDEAELQAKMGGQQQSTRRNDFLVELRDGKFVKAMDGEALDSKNEEVPGFTIHKFFTDRGAKTLEEKQKLMPEILAMGGRFIFVMSADGSIYAGSNIHKVQHHSSFLGGGAVAAAGEIQVAGGRLTSISNMSGHYQPGPGHLWQAVVQMASQGVAMGSVTAEIAMVGSMNAAELMEVFDPVRDPSLMVAAQGVKFLQSIRKGQVKPEKKKPVVSAEPEVIRGPEGKQEQPEPKMTTHG